MEKEDKERLGTDVRKSVRERERERDSEFKRERERERERGDKIVVKTYLLGLLPTYL